MSALKKIKEIPVFDIPKIYQDDKWDITSWDKYKDSHRKGKSDWRLSSSSTDHKFDFSLMKNDYIREEMKCICYIFYEEKDVCLTTFSNYYKAFQVLAEYVNSIDKASILDVKAPDYEHFLTQKEIKVSDKNTPKIEKGRCLHFLTISQEELQNYHTKDIPERKKLIWHADKLPCKKGLSGSRNLDFRDIEDEEFRKLAQDFCYTLLSLVSFQAVYTYLKSVKTFLGWLTSHPEITHLDQVDRDLIEDYFLYLRAESGFSGNTANTHILYLKKFFEWGQLFRIEYMPKRTLILAQDYAFKTQKDSRYLTDAEMECIYSVIPKMPTTYAKIVYLLIFTGMRISEALHLPVDSLTKSSDGKYLLTIHQYKTEKDYVKLLAESPAKVILSEIERNKKRFRDVKYVFVSDKNKPISASVINNNLNMALKENNIKGRDGKILHCTTHMFRATFATKLISNGKEPELVAKLLGQTTLHSLSHYAAISPKAVKEQLAPRIKKDDIIISNLWKTGDAKEEIPETAIPLCNGFCCKQIDTGICKKANTCLNCPMFIPSIQFISSYMIQLQEVEATIAIAKNCGYIKILKNCMETKKILEDIIKRLEEKRNE